MRKASRHIFIILLAMTCCFGFTSLKVAQQSTSVNYVHSKACRENILQVDCFDTCNGIQIHAKSEHNHKLPDERTMVESYDGLTIVPLRIIPGKQQVTIVAEEKARICIHDFIGSIFRPPVC